LEKLVDEFGLLQARRVTTPFAGQNEMNVTDAEIPLEQKRVHDYHRAIGKLMWVLQERPDLSYAVKELARHVQAPLERHWAGLKRLLRYVSSTLDSELVLEVDPKLPDGEIHVVCDASWASGEGRRSTSGGTIWIQGCLLQHWARTQPIVALSSCESELVAMNVAVMEAKLVQSISQEVGIPQKLHLHADSTAGLAVVSKRGPGRLRHLEVKQFWLQDEVRAGRLHLYHIDGADNVADMLTKPLAGTRFVRLCSLIGIRKMSGDAPETDADETSAVGAV